MAAEAEDHPRASRKQAKRELPIDFFRAEVIKNRYDPEVAKRGLDEDDEDDNDGDD